jgi:hypothetical protein
MINFIQKIEKESLLRLGMNTTKQEVKTIKIEGGDLTPINIANSIKNRCFQTEAHRKHIKE